MTAALINLEYLGASIFFILGVKGMTNPKTAVRGNMLGAVGMVLACIAVVHRPNLSHAALTLLVVAASSLAGLILARKVKMTSVPELVAGFNGLGGGASALVAGSALLAAQENATAMTMDFRVATATSTAIGAVTLTGSIVAFAKLKGYWRKKTFADTPGRIFLALLVTATVAALVAMVMQTTPASYGLAIIGASAAGILLVLPIGGADMPVVIALLNSYSGLAASATGFALGNNVLIIGGALVGASGTILTAVMSKAMNRSVLSILFGRSSNSAQAETEDDAIYETVKRSSADEVAMLMASATRVAVVPGYGMAVAQAQHAVSALAKSLEERDIDVTYAIHPVAGRMPGHMNVLLAEADVPYDKLKALEEINGSFGEFDVVLVIGANDVVNPVAATNPNSPIAGMPVLDVGRAQTVVVVKRSLSPGFAGVANPLFAADNTYMLFDDGKKAAEAVLRSLNEL